MLLSDSSQSILNLNKKSIGTKIITWGIDIGGYKPGKNG
jgi:hypothetical protein